MITHISQVPLIYLRRSLRSAIMKEQTRQSFWWKIFNPLIMISRGYFEYLGFRFTLDDAVRELIRRGYRPNKRERKHFRKIQAQVRGSCRENKNLPRREKKKPKSCMNKKPAKRKRLSYEPCWREEAELRRMDKMAEWQVSKQKIRLVPHPNADALDLGDVGGYQVVVQKGLYQDGDEVVFIPEKSLLPDKPWVEGFRKYLRGSNQDRVGSIRLRGEISQGIILSPDVVLEIFSSQSPHEGLNPLYAMASFDSLEFDKDISGELGILKYEPPIPTHLAGEVDNIAKYDLGAGVLSFHDVEQFGIYASEFEPGEPVIATEKIHGSQVNMIRTQSGERTLSSKGLIKRDLVIKDQEKNTYWQAVHNTGVFDLLDQHFPGEHVQAFAEVVPVQSGFNYGFQKPWLLLFDIRVNGVSIPYRSIPEDFFQKDGQPLWCPLLYEGPFDPEILREACKGTETVTGKGRHMKEGLVVRPVVDRRASKGFRLMLKVINPKYKETGEEIN